MNKIKPIKTDQQIFSAPRIVSIIIAGLALPVVLVPLIKIWTIPGSEIIEEIAKAFIVFFLILKLPSYKLQILAGIVFALLFGISESFLYFNTILSLGNFKLLGQRFLWTVPMHIITVLIILVPALKNKKLIIIGIFGAIIIHLAFNRFIIL